MWRVTCKFSLIAVYIESSVDISSLKKSTKMYVYAVSERILKFSIAPFFFHIFWVGVYRHSETNTHTHIHRHRHTRTQISNSAKRHQNGKNGSVTFFFLNNIKSAICNTCMCIYVTKHIQWMEKWTWALFLVAIFSISMSVSTIDVYVDNNNHYTWKTGIISTI